VKTSGQAGLHVLVPLGGQMSYEQSRTLGDIISRLVVDELPAAATINRVIEARGGRVYLDFLPNRPGQTLAAPFTPSSGSPKWPKMRA
jgi:bifunctional non-homologous end joining protein LigD